MSACQLIDFEVFTRGRLQSPDVRRQYLCHVRRYFESHGELPDDPESGRSSIESFIGEAPLTSRATRSAALHLLFECHYGTRFGKRRKESDYSASPQVREEVERFRNHLGSTTFMAASTISSVCSTVNQMLCFSFQQGPINLDVIDEKTVLHFLLEDKAHLLPSSRKTIAGRIRRYADFLVEDGYPHAGRILTFPLAMPVWVSASIPKTLRDDQVAAIKQAATGSMRSPLRNLAIIDCMANVGMRTCEVAALDLSDVDFAAGCITIRKTKSNVMRRLPLDPETGGVLADYVMQEREAKAGRLFLRHLHDAGAPMDVTNVRMTVRGIAAQAGVHPFGCHMLRHTAASSMINGGVSLKVIADVLGHECMQTTTTYAKVDIAHLKLAASAWPGDDHE